MTMINAVLIMARSMSFRLDSWPWHGDGCREVTLKQVSAARW